MQQPNDKKLVERIAKRLAGTMFNVNFDDLCQAAYIALWQSADKIPEDPIHAAKYKALRARGAMIDYVRQESWVPRSSYKDEDKIIIVSTDEKEDDNSWSSIDLSEDDNSDERVAIRDQKRIIEKVLQSLNERQKILIEMILEGKSMTEVSVAINVSPSRVSQMFSSITESFELQYQKIDTPPKPITKQPAPRRRPASATPTTRKRNTRKWCYDTGKWVT